MKKKSFLTRVFCGMALAMAALPSAWGQAYINTDITGPDFHITNITPDVMTFTAPFSMSFGGGRLTMKDDPSTTASITLKLYSGSPAGTLLASKTLTHRVLRSGWQLRVIRHPHLHLCLAGPDHERSDLRGGPGGLGILDRRFSHQGRWH